MEEINNFELNVKQFSLTYSRGDGLSRQLVQDCLKSVVANKYDGSVISEEAHEPKPGDQNIGLHYHVFLFLKKPLHIRSDKFFDITREHCPTHKHIDRCNENVCVYHPNIQETGKIPGVKARFDKKFWVQYVIKHDQNYLEDNFDVKAYLLSVVSKKGLSYETAALSIKSGKNLKDIDMEMPGFVLREKRKLEEYIELQDSFKRLDRKIPFPGLVAPIPYTGINCILLENFYDAINVRIRNPYRYGGKHIYVSGPTACGKSNPFSEQLPQYLNGYKWIYGGTGQSIELLTCDYIYLDEFKGQIKPDELILLLNQDPNELHKIRYGKPSKLPKRVHVFINAQNSLEDTYKNVDKRTKSALKRRLESHFLVHPIIDIDDDSDDICVPNNLILNGSPTPIRNDSPTNLSEGTTRLLLGSDSDDSFDDHSEHSNEFHSRKKSKK